MSTSLLPRLSAALLAFGGFALLFAPDIVLPLLAPPPASTPLWFGQLLGAAWLGFAVLNWLGRGSVLGGIYGRPLVGANLAHFLIGSLLLLRATFAGATTPTVWAILVLMAGLAVAYGIRLFGGPPPSQLGDSGAT